MQPTQTDSTVAACLAGAPASVRLHASTLAQGMARFERFSRAVTAASAALDHQRGLSWRLFQARLATASRWGATAGEHIREAQRLHVDFATTLERIQAETRFVAGDIDAHRASAGITLARVQQLRLAAGVPALPWRLGARGMLVDSIGWMLDPQHPLSAEHNALLAHLRTVEDRLSASEAALRGLSAQRQTLNDGFRVACAQLCDRMSGYQPAAWQAHPEASVPAGLAPPIPGIAATLAGLQAATPEAVAARWRELSDAERDALIRESSGVVGNLAGVPAEDRHAANLHALRIETMQVQHLMQLAAEGIVPASPGLRQRQSACEQLQRILNETNADKDAPPRYLLSFSARPDAPPLVATSIGNPDLAEHVTLLVPGMNSGSHRISGYFNTAETLHQSALAADVTAGGRAGQDSLATIMWLDYAAPQDHETLSPSGSVLGNDRAVEGAARFEQTLAGIAAQQFDRCRHGSINVVAHSYGATMAARALSSAPFPVDSFTMLAPAGLPSDVTDVGDLNVHNGNVFTGENRNDFVADLGRISPQHPVNPSWNEPFGANTFGTDGNTSHGPSVGHELDNGKTGYLSTGTESLWNVSNIVMGHYDHVSKAS